MFDILIYTFLLWEACILHHHEHFPTCNLRVYLVLLVKRRCVGSSKMMTGGFIGMPVNDLKEKQKNGCFVCVPVVLYLLPNVVNFAAKNCQPFLFCFSKCLILIIAIF